MARVALLSLCVLLTNCGAQFHLNRAQHNIKKAEGLGAKWHSDTLFKELKFKVPGIQVKFIPRILSSGDPMVFEKDSVITRVLVVKGKNNIDTVYVDTKCPDRSVTKLIPIEVNNNLKSGKSPWYYVPWFALSFVIGLIIGFFGKRSIHT